MAGSRDAGSDSNSDSKSGSKRSAKHVDVQPRTQHFKYDFSNVFGAFFIFQFCDVARAEEEIFRLRDLGLS